jgi:metallophosphoesterase superfamily enzyme
MPILLVHISDIHIRDAENPILQRVDQIVAALRARRLSPSACIVVAPGDIAFSGNEMEYQMAEAFFRELLSRLEQEYPGVKPDIVFVPGNHDCDMSRASDIRKASPNYEMLPTLDPIVVNIFGWLSLNQSCLLLL